MKQIDRITFILVLIGGINWGLFGLFGFNLVDFFFGESWIDSFIYFLIGVSAIHLIFSKSIFARRAMHKK